MRKLIPAVLCFIFLFGFTGCYDARELGSYAFVTAVGVDYGVTDKWRITFQIADFGSESGGGGKSETGGGGALKYKVVTIDAPSFYAGVNIINTNVPRRLNFDHTSAFVFSEAIAKADDLKTIITPLVRFWEVRRSENVIICKGSAMDFINAIEPYIGDTVSKTIQDLLDEYADNGLFPKTTLGDLYEGIKSMYKQPIAICGAVNTGDKFVKSGERYQGGFKKTGDYYAGDVPRNGGNKIELVGCIIANGAKEVAELTGIETRFLMVLNGDFKRGIFSVPDPKAKNLVVPMEIRMRGKPEIDTEIINGKVYINVRVSLDGSIMAIQSRLDYEDTKQLKELEQYAAGVFTSITDDLIKKCQDLNCDSMGFGRAVVKCFAWKTVDEWESFNWLARFKEAHINTEFKVKIRHTGTLLSDSPILYTGGKE